MIYKQQKGRIFIYQDQIMKLYRLAVNSALYMKQKKNKKKELLLEEKSIRKEKI